MQVPPFMQAFSEQSSIFTSQCLPVKPEIFVVHFLVLNKFLKQYVEDLSIKSLKIFLLLLNEEKCKEDGNSNN